MILSRSLLLAVLGLAGLVTASPPGCDANNCERAFNGDSHTVAAASFCSQFTTATTLTTNGFPSFATPACSLVAQISSVCSCAYPASSKTTSMVTSTSSSSSSQTSSSRTSTITTFTSSSTTLQTSTASSATRELAPGCHADNCLRAFDRGNGDTFCSIFTLGASLALPTYATQCTGSTSARVSSACTCLNYYGSSTVSFSSMTLSPTTTSIPSSSSSTTSTETAAPAPLPPHCNSDNCLRAMKREGGVGATAFCSSFTTAVVTNPAALPTYQTQCSKNPISQISSACSCLAV